MSDTFLFHHNMTSHILYAYWSALFLLLNVCNCLPVVQDKFVDGKSYRNDVTFGKPEPGAEPEPRVILHSVRHKSGNYPNPSQTRNETSTYGQACTVNGQCNETAGALCIYKVCDCPAGTTFDTDSCISATTHPPVDYAVWISLTAGLSLLLIIMIISSCIFWHLRRKNKRERRRREFALEHGSVGLGIHDHHNNKNNKHPDSEMETKDHADLPIEKDTDTCNQSDPWQISSSNLKIFENEKLGSGAFCFVFKGKLEGKAPVCTIQQRVATQKFENCEVAVKKLPEYADDLTKNDFLQEINFMKRIGYHSHLVSILGCVTDPSVDPCLVIEYCANGDLLKYVRNRRLEIVKPNIEDNSLRYKDLLSFAWQISDGMDFLSSKGCIHRDIAARNILVDKRRVAKIGDFGLCRLMDSTIYTTRGGRLPIKWMALESLQDYEYTTKSDVWSFGVLLFELFSLGAVPYSWVQPSEMVDYLLSGKRLDKPQNCDDAIYSLMHECWDALPEKRPQFSDLKNKLGSLLSYATEEYGYLDIRKPNGDNYYEMVPSTKSAKESDAALIQENKIIELDKAPFTNYISDFGANLAPPVVN